MKTLSMKTALILACLGVFAALSSSPRALSASSAYDEGFSKGKADAESALGPEEETEEGGCCGGMSMAT